MKKTALFFGLVSVLAATLLAFQSHASKTTAGNEFKTLGHSKWMGTAIEGTCGKVIGIVNQVMVDSGGHIFAVINHGAYDLYGDAGVNPPVPIEELKITRRSTGQNVAILKTDMEHLGFAPHLLPLQTNDRRNETDIYTYYGIRPYWIEKNSHSGARSISKGEATKRNMDPYPWGGEAQDF
jgi:hypothetical protein